MKSVLCLLFVLCSFSVAASAPAPQSQTWKLRPGDTLETISTTLEIPIEEIRKYNAGVVATHLQVGHRLKLPLRSYPETRALEQEVARKSAQIRTLEIKASGLEKKIASAESQLRWHPVWFWGFWIGFSIIAFIVFGAYWIFRQTHPRVFDKPHERSISDLRVSQLRVRSFLDEEEGRDGRGGHWQPSLRRFPHTR